MIWHFTFGKGDWLGEYLPSPFLGIHSSKCNIFNFRLFSQTVCLLVCLYISLFLKEDNNFFGNITRTFVGYYRADPNAKICFGNSQTSQGSCFQMFLAHFCVFYLLLLIVLYCHVLLFLENHSIASNHFFCRCFWY